jgi:hypothetical protein
MVGFLFLFRDKICYVEDATNYNQGGLMEQGMRLLSAEWTGPHQLKIVVEATYYSDDDYVQFIVQDVGLNPTICIVRAELIQKSAPMKGRVKEFSDVVRTQDDYDFKEVQLVFNDDTSQTQGIRGKS